MLHLNVETKVMGCYSPAAGRVLIPPILHAPNLKVGSFDLTVSVWWGGQPIQSPPLVNRKSRIFSQE